MSLGGGEGEKEGGGGWDMRDDDDTLSWRERQVRDK